MKMAFLGGGNHGGCCPPQKHSFCDLAGSGTFLGSGDLSRDEKADSWLAQVPCLYQAPAPAGMGLSDLQKLQSDTCQNLGLAAWAQVIPETFGVDSVLL